MIDERALAVAREFWRRHGRAPDGIFCAPGRVNLIGEHTDYNAGLVLPIAIDEATVVAVGRRADRVVSGWSAQLGEGGSVAIDRDEPPSAPDWLGYAAGVAWALREVAPLGGGLDLVVDSSVPVGAGLSSSAALECAVALAVSELTGTTVDRLVLAQAAQRAEHAVVGAPVGVMDQAVSLLAAPGSALLLDCRTLHIRHIPFDPDGAGFALLVVDTQVRHAHATGGYAQRRRECEQAAAMLGVAALRDAELDDIARLADPLQQRARHVVTENARVERAAGVLDAGELGDLGPLLLRSHVSLRDDFEVSTAELDLAVDAALKAGALGARMTGGGFGGAAIALVPRADMDAVEAAVVHAFAAAGFRPPSVFPVRPGGGARRLDLT